MSIGSTLPSFHLNGICIYTPWNLHIVRGSMYVLNVWDNFWYLGSTCCVWGYYRGVNPMNLIMKIYRLSHHLKFIFPNQRILLLQGSGSEVPSLGKGWWSFISLYVNAKYLRHFCQPLRLKCCVSIQF